MTPGAAPDAKNSNRGKQQVFNQPPSEVVLAPKPNYDPLYVPASALSRTQTVRLTVDFPTNPKASKPNDVSAYFKKSMTILFAGDQYCLIGRIQIKIR